MLLNSDLHSASEKLPSFGRRLARALPFLFAETYPLSRTMGAHVISQEESKPIFTPLVRFTSFLGLPNYRRLNDKITWLDVLKNMLDYSITNEKNKKIDALDIIFAVPTFLYFVAKAVFSVLLNTAKLFSEFLFGLAEMACIKLLENKDLPAPVRILAGVGLGISSALHFVARAIFSPLKGAAAASKVHSFWGVLSFGVSLVAAGLGAMFGLPLIYAGAVVPPVATYLSGVMLGLIGLVAKDGVDSRVNRTQRLCLIKSFVKALVGSSSSNKKRKVPAPVPAPGAGPVLGGSTAVSMDAMVEGGSPAPAQTPEPAAPRVVKIDASDEVKELMEDETLTTADRAEYRRSCGF